LALQFSRRLGIFTVPLALLALSACGGGGGGVIATPTVLPSATPTPTPVPNPTASGDTFAYAGSVTQTVTVFATPAPSPSASATPQPTSTPWVSTLAQTVAQNVSVSTAQSFGGQTGLTEFNAQETDASQLKTTSVASQTYLSYAQNSSRASGVDVTAVGTAWSNSDGASFQSVIAGSGIVQKLPYVYGAQWNNDAARTDTEKGPGGEVITTTYAADGSYQEQFTYPEGGTASVQANADGSGVYETPINGATTAPSSFTVNAPSGGQIQVAYEIFGAGLPSSGAFEVPVWYPQSPPVLASDTYVDAGPSTLPSSCKAGSAFQSANVEKIVETKNRLDTVFGEYETDQITQYTSTLYGLLCEVVSDDVKTYYEFSGRGYAAFDFSASPVVEAVVTETLALQSQKFASTSAVRRTAAGSPRQILPQPSFARASMALATIHAQNARTFYAHMHSAPGMRKAQ
jgi:hypothetical protein